MIDGCENREKKRWGRGEYGIDSDVTRYVPMYISGINTHIPRGGEGDTE
jgi:hypothetical protein